MPNTAPRTVALSVSQRRWCSVRDPLRDSPHWNTPKPVDDTESGWASAARVAVDEAG